MPISPSSSTLPGRFCSSVLPAAIAVAHSSIVIAGPSSMSRLPMPILAISRPGRGSKTWRTPASTMLSCSPCWRASTDTAAPPARKFSTICQVTSGG